MTVNSPKSGGATTAIIQWTISCSMFINVAILEYAMILGYKKYKISSRVGPRKKTSSAKEHKEESLFKRWDRRMAITLPVTFGLFSVAFWMIQI